MNKGSFTMIEAAREGRKKIHPIFAVILAILFLSFSGVFMLFMLVLPKVETTFMKGIYDNLRLLLTFGGTILFVFLWVRFVEKRPFSSIGFWKGEAWKKYLRGALLGFVFISIPVVLLVITGFAKLEMQHITSTFILGVLGSLVAF